MRLFFPFFLALFAQCAPAFAGDPVKFAFDARPGAFLFSPEADGFSVGSSSGSSYYYFSQRETIEGGGSWTPSVKLGVGINTESAEIDFLVGGGVLLNAAFRSSYVSADVAYRLKIGNLVTLGPRLGVLSFSAPTWEGVAPITFSKTNGTLAGLELTVGKSIAFKGSIDFVNAKFDASLPRNSGWTLSQNQLDVSGVAIQLGITGRF